MANIFRLVTMVFLLLMVQVSMAQPDVSRVLGPKFVLPLNEAEQMALLIQFPRNFHAAQSFQHENLNNKELFFIPVNNIKSQNKEIILLIPKLNSGIASEDIVDKFAVQFKKTSQKMMILKEQKNEFKGFTHAAKLILYEYQNKVQLVNLYAVSGPKHLIMLQYSINIQNKNEIQPAINKMIAFFNQNVQIKKMKIKKPEIKLKDSI